MNDFERRALNGIRAYNLARDCNNGWTADMWFFMLMQRTASAAQALRWYGVAV